MDEVIYKVVHVLNGCCYSAMGVYNSSDSLPVARWAVQYYTDAFSIAPRYLADMGYHLTVLRDKHEAVKFYNTMNTRAMSGVQAGYDVGYPALWTAEAKFEVKLPHFINDMEMAGAKPIWKISFPNLDPRKSGWPPSTAMYKQVKLVDLLSRPLQELERDDV